MPSRHDRKDPLLDRRRFLKKTAATCAAAAAAGAWGWLAYSNEPVRRRSERIRTLPNYRRDLPAGPGGLVVVRGTDVARMARAAIDRLGGIGRFVGRGERVLIKPNVGWDRQPEQAANTNPALVGAVVALCVDAGASSVWVSDVSINDPLRSFARSGIDAAVRRAGGRVRLNGDTDFRLTDLNGDALHVWPVSRFYHEVDRVINLPVVKHHSLSRATIAMKNWYGILGGRRNRLHQAIDTSIADLASAVRPTLTLIDATRVLFRNGPTGGNLSDVRTENTILAGLDEVALDAYALQFLGVPVGEVGFLAIAETRGLGVRDWNALGVETVSL